MTTTDVHHHRSSASIQRCLISSDDAPLNQLHQRTISDQNPAWKKNETRGQLQGSDDVCMTTLLPLISRDGTWAAAQLFCANYANLII